jgi:hypothetical protein
MERAEWRPLMNVRCKLLAMGGGFTRETLQALFPEILFPNFCTSTVYALPPKGMTAGAQNPKNTVQHRSRILPRSAAPIVPAFRTKQWFEHRPLGVGEVHVLDLRHWP